MQLTGTILNKFPAEWNNGKNGKKYARHDFVLKNAAGKEFKCSKFFDWEGVETGDEVTFEANHNPQYDRYTVQGEISVQSSPNFTSAAPEKGQSEETQPGPAKKKYTKKTTAAAPAPSEGLESVREEAQEAVRKNYEFAIELLGKDANQPAAALIVQSLQATIATIFINKEKDRRMASFKQWLNAPGKITPTVNLTEPFTSGSVGITVKLISVKVLVAWKNLKGMNGL